MLPSGLNATELMRSVCPLKVRNRRPESMSQSLTTASDPAEATRRPSGLKARAVTVAGVSRELAALAPGVGIPDPHQLVGAARERACGHPG